ncbi:MAG: COX15/CtaA family protein [Dongiaceae bacterium]
MAISYSFLPAHRQGLLIWLYGCAILIAIMVTIGGVTRLTESGLSITEWRPLSGVFYPQDEAAWQDAFSKYQKIPEYKIQNKGMTLEEFKKIYFWEYFHRLWGRLIGLAYALPLIFFWARGWIPGHYKPAFAGILALGALQGGLGWYMVKSGLSGGIDVSPYRLTMHLGLAFIIFAAIISLAMRLKNEGKIFIEKTYTPAWIAAGARRLMMFFALVFIYGGLMAGYKAGLVYNTWPLMDGDIIPKGIAELSPWYKNLYANVITINFLHRWLAFIFALTTIIFGIMALRDDLPRKARIALIHLMAMVIIQAGLGIVALVKAVPLHAGVAHQLGALLVLACLVWFTKSIKQ